MLMIFWDVGPLYFRDWVDTKPFVQGLFGAGGTDNGLFIFALGMSKDGQTVYPEGLVNINAMLIMLICFLVAGWSAKIRATSSMALGTFLASCTLIIFGGFNGVWLIVLGIVLFSFGEMLSSPKCSEYLGNIAPNQKKAMYLGFSQLPFGIGWMAESYLGQYFYGEYASKEQISRQVLADNGLTLAEIQSVPIGEAFEKLVSVTGVDAATLTNQLYVANSIGTVWYIMASVGILSAGGMYIYGKWTYKLAQNEM